jgi:hypothetical protein
LSSASTPATDESASWLARPERFWNAFGTPAVETGGVDSPEQVDSRLRDSGSDELKTLPAATPTEMLAGSHPAMDAGDAYDAINSHDTGGRGPQTARAKFRMMTIGRVFYAPNRWAVNLLDARNPVKKTLDMPIDTYRGGALAW